MKYKNEDVIVGIATAYQEGAISIIRLSGENAIEIVAKIFKGYDLLMATSHTIYYGHIVEYQSREVIDEVLVSVFKEPRTYTLENVVEINCHGGLFITNQIFEELVLLGARPAEAGEFTKRAFLNGRIDLTQAEAVMDIIQAENKNAVKLANKALNGEIKQMINEFKNRISEVLTIISVNIDYPEYDDVEEISNKTLKPLLIQLKTELETLLENSKTAKFIKNGIDTVIVGKPNVGKSSLLNALSKENKAIVTNIPGTTRDAIEVKINLNNYTLNLIDTAGIHDTVDPVEQIGVAKSLEKLDEAELIILMLDGSSAFTKEDIELLKQVESRKHLKIINKNDLPLKINSNDLPDGLFVSLYNNKDTILIEEAIIQKIGVEKITNKDITYISNIRQLTKVAAAIENLKLALDAIENNAFIDFVDIYIRGAYYNLGEITGENSIDNLLDELFSKFCLGK